MYPSASTMLNCSKETKLCTVLSIDNTKRRGMVKLRDDPVNPDPIVLDEQRCPGYKHFDVTSFFADAIYTEANAIAVGQRFNLPGFDGVVAYMQKHHPTLVAHAG